jgi:ArsR family metal-binding transcriptional regulator
MFIAKDYELSMEAPGCEPGAEYWNATARFQDDISAVLPYLNAQWADAVYAPAAGQLTARVEGHAVALGPHEITISGVPDRDAAVVLMERTVAAVNRIWMDREHLTPLHTSRKRLVAMGIYQLLPQTNCKLCGESTCFAFASKLTVGVTALQACLPLFEEESYAHRRQALLAMVAEAAI